ncbi:MAG: ABC transporter permease [Desulfobacterales bacterium]|jgi:ABC-type lipoprotein release transport system permease subunit|nr:ABC transporter permease [Desulfobacterales bacterium]
MKLLFAYSLRNMLARRLTTALTAGGMALVVFAFAAIVMLAEGLETTLVDSGSFQNAVVIRKSATSEVQSGVSRSEAAIVATQPEIAMGVDGAPLVAKEVVVLINLRKRGSASTSNVTIRGTSGASLELRPEVRLIAGRAPRPGSAEIMVGEGIARRFENAGLDDTIAFARSDWRVTGIFDAGNTAFSSEIWGDAEQFMQAFRRQAYSSVTFRMRDAETFSAVKERIEADPRLTCEVKREVAYYREQSELTAKFLRVLGTALTLIFSIGAVVGAMITMYAAVATRTSEIGTLRAVGFQRAAILSAFLVESLLLGAAGGAGGLLLASFLQFFTVSTTNFQTFSELAFQFRLSPAIVLEGMLFALLMGLAGGLLPAFRAARMNIVEALRAA